MMASIKGAQMETSAIRRKVLKARRVHLTFDVECNKNVIISFYLLRFYRNL